MRAVKCLKVVFIHVPLSWYYLDQIALRPIMAHRDLANDSDSTDALEVSVLRDVAKKSLVDALNSVRMPQNEQLQ